MHTFLAIEFDLPSQISIDRLPQSIHSTLHDSVFRQNNVLLQSFSSFFGFARKASSLSLRRGHGRRRRGAQPVADLGRLVLGWIRLRTRPKQSSTDWKYRFGKKCRAELSTKERRAKSVNRENIDSCFTRNIAYFQASY